MCRRGRIPLGCSVLPRQSQLGGKKDEQSSRPDPKGSPGCRAERVVTGGMARLGRDT